MGSTVFYPERRPEPDADERPVTIIKVRRGINGFRYSACDRDGCFIGNFDRLSGIRRHWETEVRRGTVLLVRELDRQPDMSRHEAAVKMMEGLLAGYAAQGRRREQNKGKQGRER